MTTEGPLANGQAQAQQPNRAPGSAQIRLVSPREWFRLALVFCVFFFAFRWAPHLWIGQKLSGIPLWDNYVVWQSGTDSIVVGRLAQNQVGGIWSGQGFLGSARDYYYTHQSGTGGWLLSLLPTAVGAHGAAGVEIMYAAVAGFNALLATLAVRAMSRTLSVGAAVVTAFALLQPWPVLMARSIYWMIGLELRRLPLSSSSIPGGQKWRAQREAVCSWSPGCSHGWRSHPDTNSSPWLLLPNSPL